MRVAEVVVVVAAVAAGLAWALPSAGIGLTLGFAILGTVYGSPLPMPRPAVFVVALGCVVVAYLGATHDLGIGYRFIPTVLPFLLLALALPSVAQRALHLAWKQPA